MLSGLVKFLRLMLQSMVPSWYRSFHLRSYREHWHFAVCLLLFHTGLRTLMFYYWNMDTFSQHTFESCIDKFEQKYPNDVVFGMLGEDYYDGASMTMKRSKYPFYMEKYLTSQQRWSNHGTTQIRLPQCLVDYLGLATSYMLKNSVSREGKQD